MIAGQRKCDDYGNGVEEEEEEEEQEEGLGRLEHGNRRREVESRVEGSMLEWCWSGVDFYSSVVYRKE